MGMGKHKATKKTVFESDYWSHRSYAPHCNRGCKCPRCETKLHAEEGEHYCPGCDDYVRPIGKFHEARG